MRHEASPINKNDEPRGDKALARGHGPGDCIRHGLITEKCLPGPVPAASAWHHSQDSAATRNASGRGEYVSERYLPEGMKHSSQAYELLADRFMAYLT